MATDIDNNIINHHLTFHSLLLLLVLFRLFGRSFNVAATSGLAE